jgi:hypothetical protein
MGQLGNRWASPNSVVVEGITTAKAVAADYDNAARLYNGNGTNVPENTNFNSSENLYDKIKAKQQLVDASVQNTILQKQQYLPDVTLSAQQSFGTII